MNRYVMLSISLWASAAAAGPVLVAPAAAPPDVFCAAIDAKGIEIVDARRIVLDSALTLKTSATATTAGTLPTVTCDVEGTLATGLTIKNKDACHLSDPKTFQGNQFVKVNDLCVLKTSGTMRNAIPDDKTEALTFKDGKAQVKSLAADGRVLMLPDDTQADMAMQTLDKVAATFKGRVVWFDGTEFHAASTSKQPPPPTETDAMRRAKAEERAGNDCRSAVGKDNGHSKVLCFLASDKLIVPIDHRDPDLVIRPNTPIVVVVTYSALADGSRITVTAEGQVGVFTPGTRNETGITANADTGKAEAPEPLPFIQPLGPYLPGAVTVHVRVVPTGTATPIDLPTQLIVEETYAGALRLGIGGIFGGAIERNLALRTQPGSSQPEIVATNAGDMDAELVLGAAIFLETGGRGYVVPTHNAHFAPYFGIGILDQTDNGLKVLRSLHLGLEYEFNAHFAIAVTVVGRRVTRLSGAKLGDPVPMGGMLPTETGFAFGGAVVISLSPDFFKLATKSGSSFFGGK